MKRGAFRLALALAAIVPGTGYSLGGDAVSARGYVKSFYIDIHPAKTEGAGAGDPDRLWAWNNRARLDVEIEGGRRADFHLSYDLSLRVQHDDLFAGDTPIGAAATSPYRIDDLDAILAPDDPGEGDHVALYQNLDRLGFAWHPTWGDLTVGRQAIAWGSARAINPTDVLVPFLYTEIDKEDRSGVDAVRLRLPVGALGEIDAGLVPGVDFRREESAAFARGRFYAFDTDCALLVMAFREHLLAGIDLARAVGGAGTWCEAACVRPGAAAEGGGYPDEEAYVRLTAGADYNFNIASGTYAFLEYHHNGSGAGAPGDYLRNAAARPAAYEDGAVYLLGRHYAVPGLSWQPTGLTTVAAQALVNLEDGSLLIVPSVEYNVAENLYLSAGGYVGFGDRPALERYPIPGLPGSTPLVPVLRSEFGSYPDQYYAFVRYYY